MSIIGDACTGKTHNDCSSGGAVKREDSVCGRVPTLSRSGGLSMWRNGVRIVDLVAHKFRAFDLRMPSMTDLCLCSKHSHKDFHCSHERLGETGDNIPVSSHPSISTRDEFSYLLQRTIMVAKRDSC